MFFYFFYSFPHVLLLPHGLEHLNPGTLVCKSTYTSDCCCTANVLIFLLLVLQQDLYIFKKNIYLMSHFTPFDIIFLEWSTNLNLLFPRTIHANFDSAWLNSLEKKIKMWMLTDAGRQLMTKVHIVCSFILLFCSCYVHRFVFVVMATFINLFQYFTDRHAQFEMFQTLFIH